jgi:hypothetical protein
VAFNHKRRGGREIGEIYPDWGLSDVFEESWLGKGVDANGRGSPFAQSRSNVGLKSSRPISIGEGSKGNGSNY